MFHQQFYNTATWVNPNLTAMKKCIKLLWKPIKNGCALDSILDYFEKPVETAETSGWQAVEFSITPGTYKMMK